MKFSINHEKSLYVLPCGKDHYSCLGFDVCIQRATALAKELGETFNEERGSEKAYERYQELCAIAQKKSNATGWRSASELTPELIGKEGRRVEVVDSYGETRRFLVGKSTGFIPCHLELSNKRSSGGGAVTGAPFKSVRIVS